MERWEVLTEEWEEENGKEHNNKKKTFAPVSIVVDSPRHFPREFVPPRELWTCLPLGCGTLVAIILLWNVCVRACVRVDGPACSRTRTRGRDNSSR